MKTKNLAIILVLALLILAAGSAYSRSGLPRSTIQAHPWEDLNNNGGPSGSSAMVPQEDDPKVILIPIFSDFSILIYIKDIDRENSDSRSSIKSKDKSYQIIFPW